jgi:hypothetical protein
VVDLAYYPVAPLVPLQGGGQAGCGEPFTSAAAAGPGESGLTQPEKLEASRWVTTGMTLGRVQQSSIVPTPEQRSRFEQSEAYLAMIYQVSMYV